MNFGFLWRASAIAVAFSTILCACDNDEIRAYRAPKPPPKAVAKESGVSVRVVWTVPHDWESVASKEPMRLATFKTGEGLPEVTLNAFPGDTGGLLANVNRWRGQMGLAAIDEVELSKSAETVTVEGVKVTTVDIAGSTGQEMLGAVIVPGDGQTWFVKTTGEPAAIARLKPVFGAFARSFRLHAEPAATSASAKPGDVDARLREWKPASHWKVDPNPPTFVTAGFDANNGEGGAKITATKLPNNGGGLLSNINRWRDQMGLPLLDKLEQQPTTELGRGCVLVDLSSTDSTRRMLAAVLALPSQTWFFKITGTPKSVEAERAEYERFVRSVGLGEGAP